MPIPEEVLLRLEHEKDAVARPTEDFRRQVEGIKDVLAAMSRVCVAKGITLSFRTTHVLRAEKDDVAIEVRFSPHDSAGTVKMLRRIVEFFE